MGAEDHFKHDRNGIVDLRDNEKPVKDKEGVYSARLFAKVIWALFNSTYNFEMSTWFPCELVLNPPSCNHSFNNVITVWSRKLYKKITDHYFLHYDNHS